MKKPTPHSLGGLIDDLGGLIDDTSQRLRAANRHVDVCGEQAFCNTVAEQQIQLAIDDLRLAKRSLQRALRLASELQSSMEGRHAA